MEEECTDRGFTLYQVDRYVLPLKHKDRLVVLFNPARATATGINEAWEEWLKQVRYQQ